MYTPKAELKAGIVVLAALGVLGVFLYRAAGSRLPWAQRDRIHLRFEQGFAAPSQGDAVYMNGVKIGNVDTVRQRTEIRGAPDKDGKTIPLTDRDRAKLKLKPGEPGVFRELYVAAVVELAYDDQKIPKGTRGEINVTVTGEKRLSLLPGPSPEDIKPADTETEPILTSAAGDLSAVMREAEEVVRKLGGLVDDARPAIADVRAVIAEIRRKVESIDLAGIQQNVLDGSKDLREALAGAKARIDEIGARIADASTNVKAITEDAKQGVKDLVADLRAVATNLKSASAEIDAVVQRNSKKVDGILDDVSEVARSAKSMVTQFDGLGDRLHGVIGTAGEDLNRFLARMAEVGHNLSDVTEDLRAHPWKLINKPDEKEIAFENLRNAASNLVRTQRTIEESLRKIRQLEGRKDVAAPDREALLKKAYEGLKGDLARFDDASRFFLDMLKSGSTQPPR